VGEEFPVSCRDPAGRVDVRALDGGAATAIRLKVWPANGSEPTAWQTTATDTTAALQTTGAVGLSSYLSGRVTNSPVVLRLDDLNARPVG
jgi:hypothetical protein